jgi:hypothetical protein
MNLDPRPLGCWTRGAVGLVSGLNNVTSPVQRLLNHGVDPAVNGAKLKDKLGGKEKVSGVSGVNG